MLETVALDSYRLQGRLDMQADTQVLQAVLALGDSRPAGVLTLDVGALESVDSLLLAAILHVQRRLQAAGKTLAVTGLTAGMRGLARVYGIDALIESSVKL
ncbi:MAG TPA: STAS domain-containing protein [Pseudomonadales bacterium]|nr:STAS domain-containing protein [Pseudomonadales bacterium]